MYNLFNYTCLFPLNKLILFFRNKPQLSCSPCNNCDSPPRSPKNKKSLFKLTGKVTKKRANKFIKQKVSSPIEMPATPVRNRRSTMDFQTAAEMSVKRKLKIDKLKRPSIVCTKFHKDEVSIFNQIVRKLGKFVIEDEVSRKTTHVVAGEPKRTINMLRAMSLGCWILKKEWVSRYIIEKYKTLFILYRLTHSRKMLLINLHFTFNLNSLEWNLLR